MIKTKHERGSSNPQQIVARDNALYRICVVALLCLLVSVIAGFGFLIGIREPALQNEAAQHISALYAEQQAVNVEQKLAQIRERLHKAAQSPLIFAAITRAPGTDNALAEQAILDYFPLATRIEIIPIGAAGTSILRGSSEGLRNHIEMDLARRASTGETTKPEAYTFDGKHLISLAASVSPTQTEGRRGVIMVTTESTPVTRTFMPVFAIFIIVALVVIAIILVLTPQTLSRQISKLVPEAKATTTESDINDGSIPKHIFRAYDIRGIANTELTDEVVGKIGGALASIADEAGEQAFIVASDCRQSSPRIKAALIKALREGGRDVIDIGTVPTPVLYFATHHLACTSGVIITGSHNPGEYNGLKIVLHQQAIGASGIENILDRINTGHFVKGNGGIIREDVVPAYLDEVVGNLSIAAPLKIVLDTGNGATSIIAPVLFEKLGCEVVPLFCEFDGRFPNRPPDTGNEDNLTGLIAKVLEERADFGVAFDGDGDRLAVVTSSGQLIRTDTLLMLFAQDVVSRHPGSKVVYDVKCSSHLTQLITRYGGSPVLCKTGHAFMRQKMHATGALLGGEFSGHIVFTERWFGFDDGMYAAGRLAEIVSSQGTSLDESLAEFPTTKNTPEILIPVAESDKFPLIKKIIDNATFPSGEVNSIDGIRVDYKEGWGLVRASNTTAALTARFEGSSSEELDTIMQEFRTQIGLVEPNLNLPF